MEEVIISVIVAFFSITGFVTLTGFLVYKGQLISCTSWEDAIKQSVKGVGVIIKLIWYEITGYVPDDKIINSSLILGDDEVLDIVKRLEKNPYISPHLINYVSNDNCILRLRVGAMRLFHVYKGLSNDEISKMCWITLKNYYLETRKTVPLIWVTMATQTNVEFAIALSEEGAKHLRQQQPPLILKESESDDYFALEEEIDLLEENKYDSRISL